MRDIRLIVIHCADTPDDMDIGVKEIRRWHVEGNGWDDIGYHAVIGRSGEVEQGRPIDTPGAHVRGHNEHSIGICLVGRYEYTDAQWRSLEGLVRAYKSRRPGADVMGHADLDSGKTCPNFSVLSWWNEAMKHG